MEREYEAEFRGVHEATEDEAGADVDEAEDRHESAGDRAEDVVPQRHLQDDRREENLQADPGENELPVDGAPVARERPGDADERRETEKAEQQPPYDIQGCLPRAPAKRL